MKRVTAPIVALCCAISCVTLAAVEIWPVAHVSTADQNGDGRADLWRHYDTRGQLAEIDRDTNFDGTPDVQEYYDRGVLVRRESDRNFNGQTDLVEEFDPLTQTRMRSVVDVDYDGTADLLVLFQDGRPVFSKRIQAARTPQSAPQRSPSVRRLSDGQRLTALIDPTDGDVVLRRIRTPLGDQECVGLSTSGGLPRPSAVFARHLPCPETVVQSLEAADSLTTVRPQTSRAPPLP